MKLIMYQSLFDGISQIASISSYYPCDYHGQEIFAATVFFSTDVYDQGWSLRRILVSNQILCIFTLYMSLLLSTMLSIDLIMMVKYPFDQSESRTKWYLIISVMISLFCTTFINVNSSYLTDSKIGVWFMITVTVTYLAIFVYSIVFTCKSLSGPGMSKEARSLVLKRHIITNVAYLICNLYFILNSYMLAKDMENSMLMSSYDWYWKVLKFLFFAQSVIIPLLRLSEPFFY